MTYRLNDSASSNLLLIKLTHNSSKIKNYSSDFSCIQKGDKVYLSHHDPHSRCYSFKELSSC